MHVVFHRWCCFRHDWPSATFDQQMSHRWCCCLPLPFWLPFRPLWMPSPGPLSLEEGFLLEALATVGAGLLPLGSSRFFGGSGGSRGVFGRSRPPCPRAGRVGAGETESDEDTPTGAQLLSLRRLWLLEQASQWALLPLLLPLLRRRTPSSLPLIPVLSHPPEQALQTTVAGATKTSNTFLSWSQTYRHIHIQDSVPHIIFIFEVSI